MNEAQVLRLGSRFRTIRSAVGSIVYDSNNVRTLELPRSFLYKTMLLQLNGLITVSVAGSALASDEVPLELIKKIEVIADGRKTIVAGSARSFYRLAHIQRGKAGQLTGPTDATVQTNTVMAGTILLDFEAARMIRPPDSYFDPRPYEKVELRITWGTTTDIITGGTVAIDSTTAVTVHLIQTTEGADMVGFNRIQTFDEVPVTASSSALTQRIPRVGLLAHVLLSSLRGKSTNDTIINYASLRSDNNFLHFDRLGWTPLQKTNVVEYQLDGPSIATGKVAGHGYIDLTEDGLLSSAINTLDLNNLDLVLDVTSGGATDIVRVQYVFYEPIV